MEFSDIFYGRKAVYSPDAKYVSIICGDTIDVRFSDSLLKAFKFDCRDVVKHVGWSGDSLLLFAASGHSSLKIFSVLSGSCVASLKQPTGSISQILWAPDCRRVIFLESLLFRVTVWNLLEEEKLLSLNYISNVQPWARPCVAFSQNGKHLAVVTTDLIGDASDGCLKSKDHSKKEDKECGDHITILSAITWRKEKIIRCDGVGRVGGIQWSPDNDAIAIWPSYPPDSVFIVSMCAENIVAHWTPSDSLFWPGVAEVAFSPSAQFMATISYNSRIHLLNYCSWDEEIELLHQLPLKSEGCRVFQQKKTFNSDSLCIEIKERPLSVSLLSMPLKDGSKSKVCWSSGGRYLATCISRAPAVVWIWNLESAFSLACIIALENPLQDFSWDPVHNMLAIVCGDDCVSLWIADKGSPMCVPVCVPVPSLPFQAIHLNWHFNGKAVAVSSEQNSTILELSAIE